MAAAGIEKKEVERVLTRCCAPPLTGAYAPLNQDPGSQGGGEKKILTQVVISVVVAVVAFGFCGFVAAVVLGVETNGEKELELPASYGLWGSAAVVEDVGIGRNRRAQEI